MSNNIPIVEDVMDPSRPSTQEKGSDMAIAPVPIFPTCRHNIINNKRRKPCMAILSSVNEKLLILPVAAQENRSKQAC